MLIDLNNFLEKDWVEKYFNQNSEKIFQKKSIIKVLNIDRAKTFNQKSFNILYDLMLDNTEMSIRLSSSSHHDIKKAYNSLCYYYSHGFNQGFARVPRPLTYIDDLDAMFYENITGSTFMNDVYFKDSDLLQKIKLVALTLKRIHSLPIPEFNITHSDWQAEESSLKKDFPEIANRLSSIKENIFVELSKNSSRSFCHGDFKPNNLIISDGIVYIIDFGSTDVTNKELDIASFLIQFQADLNKNKIDSIFSALKNEFLKTYGDYDENKLKLYLGLLSIVLLEFSYSFPDFEDSKNKIIFFNNLVKENLRNIDIEYDEKI